MCACVCAAAGLCARNRERARELNKWFFFYCNFFLRLGLARARPSLGATPHIDAHLRRNACACVCVMYTYIYIHI